MTTADPKAPYYDLLEQAGETGDSNFPLFEAALACAALDHEGEDIEAYRAHALDLVDSVKENASGDDADPEQIAQLLSDALAGGYGYEGDGDTYEAPENADIIDVIERRRGLPVALGVLYIHVARAFDWPVYGVNLPGHFVLAVGDQETPVIFDPFNKGQILSAEDVATLMMQAEQEAGDDGTYRLSGMTDREVLMRLLNNQRMRAAQGGDADWTAEILRRMVLIVPDSGPLWSDYAKAAQAAGIMRAAIGAFEKVSELSPATDMSAEAQIALLGLRKQLN